MSNQMRTWSLLVLRQFLHLALSALHMLAAAASAAFKSRAALHLENLALRHQLGVLRRSVKRPKLTSADRLLWAWLCEAWSDWRSALVIVKPETVIGWHRKGSSRPWFRSTSSRCRRSGFRSCTCSWFWLTSEGGSCISTSLPIRRPSGPHSNSERPFPLSRSLVTCFGTATESTAVSFRKM